MCRLSGPIVLKESENDILAQICTDDFARHSAHNIKLLLKIIITLTIYGNC